MLVALLACALAMTSEETRRLNKCLDLSRRQADKAIFAGRVSVDGRVITNPATRVMSESIVCLDGKVQTPASFRYVKYWKPEGVVCTADPSARRNVIAELGFAERVFSVGRLDKQSTGLLLLTNDGRVPIAVRSRPKVYRVEVFPAPTGADLVALRNGVTIDIAQSPLSQRAPRIVDTLPCRVHALGRYTLEFHLIEGKNRQIRRMCEARGLTVKALHRVMCAGITLDGLSKAGDWVDLDSADLDVLFGLNHARSLQWRAAPQHVDSNSGPTASPHIDRHGTKHERHPRQQ